MFSGLPPGSSHQADCLPPEGPSTWIFSLDSLLAGFLTVSSPCFFRTGGGNSSTVTNPGDCVIPCGSPTPRQHFSKWSFVNKRSLVGVSHGRMNRSSGAGGHEQKDQEDLQVKREAFASFG